MIIAESTELYSRIEHMKSKWAQNKDGVWVAGFIISLSQNWNLVPSHIHEHKPFGCKQLDHDQLVSIFFLHCLPLDFMNGFYVFVEHSLDQLQDIVIHWTRNSISNFLKFNWTKTKISLINFGISFGSSTKTTFIIVSSSKHKRKSVAQNIYTDKVQIVALTQFSLLKSNCNAKLHLSWHSQTFWSHWKVNVCILYWTHSFDKHSF